jgi:predicted pyridoxine 5'-phosphate oxidase superfamily flavin-nucleotide-binding protein
MGKQFADISESIQQFIEKQKIFFVGTAATEGRVNVSPKGMDSLRVISPTKLIWLNLTGSGNETAAHLIRNPRMTIMFCAFEGSPMILRVYGKATIYHERDSQFQKFIEKFEPSAGARQIIELDVDLVQTSCGFGVPIMVYKEERKYLRSWAEKNKREKVKEYWNTHNLKSIDGFETGINKL